MKITIDTKEDSHHEIQKAITLLQALISGHQKHSNIFEDDSSTLPTTDTNPSSEGGLFNMFGADNTPPPRPPVVDEKKEEKDDVPQIREY